MIKRCDIKHEREENVNVFRNGMEWKLGGDGVVGWGEVYGRGF